MQQEENNLTSTNQIDYNQTTNSSKKFVPSISPLHSQQSNILDFDKLFERKQLIQLYFKPFPKLAPKRTIKLRKQSKKEKKQQQQNQIPVQIPEIIKEEFLIAQLPKSIKKSLENFTFQTFQSEQFFQIKIPQQIIQTNCTESDEDNQPKLTPISIEHQATITNLGQFYRPVYQNRIYWQPIGNKQFSQRLVQVQKIYPQVNDQQMGIIISQNLEKQDIWKMMEQRKQKLKTRRKIKPNR